jgi:hypothetical protein
MQTPFTTEDRRMMQIALDEVNSTAAEARNLLEDLKHSL